MDAFVIGGMDALRQRNEIQVVRVGMTHAVRADPLWQSAISAPDDRPLQHVVW